MNGWYLVILSLNCLLTASTALCYWVLRRALAGTSLKSLTSLLVDVSDLRSAFEQLREGFQRLNSRTAMRELRAKQREAKDEATPETSGQNGQEVSLSSREAKLTEIRAKARQLGVLR